MRGITLGGGPNRSRSWLISLIIQSIKILIGLVITVGSGFYIGRWASPVEPPVEPFVRLTQNPSENSNLQSDHAQLALCRDELKALARDHERQSLELAQQKRARLKLEELLKLFEFNTKFSSHAITFGMITSSPDQPLHIPFIVCLTQEDQEGITVRSGDLVAAQGALLGEISEAVKEMPQCFHTLPTVSKLASFEVRLSRSGVRGVTVGLGAESSKEDQGEMIRLKYLERSRPALIGERAEVIVRSPKAELYSFALETLPTLVIGEVIQSEMEENGLFQSAKLTLPLQRPTIKWVSIISMKDTRVTIK